MEPFALYLLKSAAWLSSFALIFLLFLRKERFFILKRVYLLCGILISVTFPLISVHYKVELPQPEIISFEAGNVIDVVTPAAAYKNLFSFKYIFIGLYLAGMVFLMIRSIYQMCTMIRSIKRSKVNDLGNAKLIRSSEFRSSFSFFRYIFVNPQMDENEMKEIMNHELVHVNQKHWVDLVLAESIRILQWVNPFAWIYSAFIKLNHEYIADEIALQHSSDPAVYKAALLNHMFGTQVVSLSNSFNYSITKTRFEMMKKNITSPFRKLKLLLVFPVIAILFFAFAEPEFKYIAPSGSPNLAIPGELTSTAPAVSNSAALPNITNETPAEQKQITVKGIITDKDGQPLADAVVRSSGIYDDNFSDYSDENGRFEIVVANKDATLFFSSVGYKQLELKAEINKEMKVVLEKEPEARIMQQDSSFQIYIDGIRSPTDNLVKIKEELGYNWGLIRNLRGKEATDKYGPGVVEAVEITTRKKALEMGLNPPYPRLKPDDYPTFQGETYSYFNEWLAGRVNYPSQAKAENVQGWVSVKLTVGNDGVITGVEPVSYPNKLLLEEVIKTINSAPKFDPPKNPEVNDAFTTEVTVRFRLPASVTGTDIPFVVVEKMPMYPGGDAELLKFIAENIRYPEEAKKNSIGGRVILRFVVTTEGTAENVTVLRGVDPLLDAEATRVVSLLKGFAPGMQSGKAVNVWYMVPITFSTPSE